MNQAKNKKFTFLLIALLASSLVIGLVKIPQVHASTTDTIGGIGHSDGSACGEIDGWAITATASGTLQSIGINIATASGNARVGIYSTYSSSKFSGLLGQSVSTALSSGWNDIAVTGVSIVLDATYYVVLITDGSTTRWYFNAASEGYYVTFTYDALPDPTDTLTSEYAIANMRITYAPSATTTDTIGSMASHDTNGGILCLLGYAITASASGSLTSIGIDIYSASGNLRAAIYSTYSSSKFSGLLGQSADTVAVNGWNDLAVSGVSIVQDVTYYVCWQSSTGVIYYYYVASGTEYYLAQSYVAFTDPSGTVSSNTFTTNMRINYITASGQDLSYHLYGSSIVGSLASSGLEKGFSSSNIIQGLSVIGEGLEKGFIFDSVTEILGLNSSGLESGFLSINILQILELSSSGLENGFSQNEQGTLLSLLESGLEKGFLPLEIGSLLNILTSSFETVISQNLVYTITNIIKGIENWFGSAELSGQSNLRPLIPHTTSLAPFNVTIELYFLIALFIFFVVLAFYKRDPYLFAVASFISIIFGVYLVTSSIGTVVAWEFSIVGFAVISFGVWLLVAAYQYSLRDKKASK